MRTITWLGAAVALLAGSRKRLMRCLQVLTVAVPMVVALGCKDATAPLSRAARDIRASQAALVIPATTMQVSSGFQGTCALKTDGTLVCWGPGFASTVPSGLTSVAQVSLGYYHACALKTDGTVVCWGLNNSGQATVPSGLASVAQVSAGGYDTCALKTDGTVVCWGGLGFGEATVPTGLASVAQVSAGAFHTCALKTDGTVVCWGDNEVGQATVPPGLTSVAQVSAGGNDTCALKTDGTVVCWGDNSYGLSTVPAGLAAVAQVSVGSILTCALKTDGTVVCWGSNQFPQTPVPPGLASVAQVSAGFAYACALKTDGTVVCWGDNTYGQLNVPAGLNLIVSAPQSIAFTSAAPSPASVGATYAVTATATSGLPVTYSTSTPGMCSVSGTTVTFIAVGTCTVAADQAGNATHLAAPEQTQSITVVQRPQTITFISTPPSPALTGGAYTVTVTGGASGNAVTLGSLTPSVCTVSGNSVSLVAVGSCTVAANQAAGNGYAAASQVTQVFTIASSAQSITFTSSPPGAPLVNGSYALSAVGGASGNPITFSSLTASVCTVSGSTASFVGIGTCSVVANQAGGNGYQAAPQAEQDFVVTGTGQTITFNSELPSPGVVGGTYTLFATGGGSGNPLIFSSATPSTCSVAGNQVSALGAGTCAVAANQAGGLGYFSATAVTRTFIVFAVPTSKDSCKDDGWRTLAQADGSTFKNQGNCIQYANTGK